jgi:hypothetical protein
MNITQFSFIFNIFIATASFGQNTALLGKYFHVGMVIPMVHIRDKGHSPLIYSGNGLKFQLGFEYHRLNTVARSQFSYTYSPMRPSSKPIARPMLSNSEYNRIQLSYGYYMKWQKDAPLLDINSPFTAKNWFGAMLNVDFTFNDYNLPSNNLFGYYGVASLLASSRFQQAFQKDSTKSFNYEATIPVLSYSVRPNYIGMMPLEDGTFNFKSILKQGKWSTLNQLFHFYNRFELQTQNKFYIANRFKYEWEFRNNTNQEAFRSITGGFGYETLFKR